MMKWEGFRRKQSCPDNGTIPAFACRHYENHEEPQPVSQLRFEPSTSQIQVHRITGRPICLICYYQRQLPLLLQLIQHPYITYSPPIQKFLAFIIYWLPNLQFPGLSSLYPGDSQIGTFKEAKNAIFTNPYIIYNPILTDII
jgi:hypothetical protein